MTNERVQGLQTLGGDIVERARKSGADVAEVLIRESTDLSAKVRLEAPELIEEAGSKAIGLRVIVGGRSASTYTSDVTANGLQSLVSDAMELAQLSEPDPLSMPPDASLLVKSPPKLDLFDPSSIEIDARLATEQAVAGEHAARAFDDRISNSEGATYGRTVRAMALITSGGFAHGYEDTYQSIVVNPVSDDEGGKKRTGYFWDARRHVSSMMAASQVGEEAARRTLAKLGAKKIETCELPVVFDPDAGRALLGLLFSCINGYSIYKRSSYLCEREGDTIASPGVTIVDDPLIDRAPGSRPFDGEGLASRRNVVVENGVLRTYLLDSYSARKLEKESTGSATRGIGGKPSVGASNFHLVAGDRDPESITSDVKRGLYVTSMMGFGFNGVTGDFSRGAEGFMIEDGKRTFPVGEITISLNFNELWKNIDAIGNDLDPKTSVATPTFRVSRMTIAGS